jgi:RNA-directed DNA polymerase
LDKAKPFNISKRVVWEAYKRVKTNKGVAGVDGESIAEFEKDLQNNLYKLWNRMSSGSYFPSPVRAVEIPKDDGRKRPLGIPTVSDRIAQTVVKAYFEPDVESCFHQDSFGYRPGKSAIEAVGVARQRCWWYDWVIDLDIKGFFDNLDHELLMRAVRKHTDWKWIILYIERWLKASVQLKDGSLIEREKGTPQGGVISPLLANLFLHYAFDEWMRRKYPSISFERYADDIIVHCGSERQAKWIKSEIEKRLLGCKLELHPEKTKVVYCKDSSRRGKYLNDKFDFLGYTFRPRLSKSRKGDFFVSFSPAVSVKAAKKMRRVMRSWRVHLRSDKSIEELSQFCNPVLRGWMNYYGRYRGSELSQTFRMFNRILIRWAMRKYRKLKRLVNKTICWLGRISINQRWLFVHWQAGFRLWVGQ